MAGTRLIAVVRIATKCIYISKQLIIPLFGLHFLFLGAERNGTGRRKPTVLIFGDGFRRPVDQRSLSEAACASISQGAPRPNGEAGSRTQGADVWPLCSSSIPDP